MHKFAKFALVFTSLLPVFVGYGISHVIDPKKREWPEFWLCIGLAALVFALAWYILSLRSRRSIRQ